MAKAEVGGDGRPTCESVVGVNGGVGVPWRLPAVVSRNAPPGDSVEEATPPVDPFLNDRSRSKLVLLLLGG